MTGKIAKFCALSWPERRLLLTSVLLLPLFWIGLRVAGLSRFQAWLNRSPIVSGAPKSHEELAAVGALVNIAGYHSPAPSTCLTRSLLLAWLLRRRGVQGELRIGVRLVDSKLEAHAWVEYQGNPINETHDVSERYAAFDGPLSPGSFTSP